MTGPKIPQIDISTPEAAKASLQEIDRWQRQDATIETVAQMQRVRMIVDNMRFKSAHESEALKKQAHEEIDKLRAMLAGAA